MARFVQFYGLLSVFIRGATLSLQSLVIGGIVFLLFVAPSQGNSRLREWESLRWVRRWSLALAVIQTAYLFANTVVLVELGDMKLSDLLGADFVTAGIIALVSALVIAIRVEVPRQERYLLIPAASILASSVMTSHAISRLAGRFALLFFTASHQAATAAWLGGLPYLLLCLRNAPGPAAQELCARFSKLALLSVSILIAAGVSLGYVYVGSWEAFYGTSYGVMLGGKVVLLWIVLMVGFLNFRLVRRGIDSGRSIAMKLRRFGEVEIAVGFSIILAAASLSSLPPAADLLAGRVTRAEIAARLRPRWPRLCASFASEPCQQSSDLLWQPRVSSPSLEPRAPGQTGVRLGTAAGIAWSEYNHHWAGLAVFAMGFFAFLARTGKAHWAGNWPLLFLGLGAFIIYRADPENWPLGPNGFWTSFADPEVLLHRVFAVLIITFGVFERRVQTGHVIFQRVSLVFPSIAALGSALLLTHSHNLGSTKEEVLAELSHTLLAILGMVAGASRWLELRLPSEDRTRQVVSWLWPLCLLLIGMILWNYRES